MAHDSIKNPFFGKIVERSCLNKEETERPTWHIVVDVSGRDMHYKPGDNLAIIPENNPRIVDEILAKVPHADEQLREHLLKKAELPQTAFTGPAESFEAFLKNLPPIRPRLYSIASSQEACPGFVHLIVSERPCEIAGQKKEGVCSSFLCKRAEPGVTKIGLFLVPSRHTLFPREETIPRIMIAAGTGIAPFRAFLQEESHFGSKLGRYWLFFGEKRQNSDFFYEDFFKGLAERGLRLSTAFSRDSHEKRYVQHTLLDHKKELFSWIQSGASIYVCGSLQMGQAVEEAFLKLVEEEGKMSQTSAQEILQNLKNQKKFFRDLYC